MKIDHLKLLELKKLGDAIDDEISRARNGVGSHQDCSTRLVKALVEILTDQKEEISDLRSRIEQLELHK